MPIRSFDVFDTVLCRMVAAPSDLFVGLGEMAKARHLHSLSPNQFCHLRIDAEARARQKSSHSEPNLEEVYEELRASFPGNSEALPQILKLELELEQSGLFPVPEMRRQIDDARQEGQRVVFLTDMYLPAAFVEAQLRRFGLFQDGDRLWVSCEHRTSKARGGLYEIARKSFKSPGSAWSHVGDNAAADVQSARRKGIEAQLYAACWLNRYEELAAGEQEMRPSWRSRLAGAMRRTRLENPETESHHRVIWDTGADVAGPMLVGFVHWCLEQARERGLKRLYFVSRDGQIMLRLATRIARAWGFNLDLRYLFGSRQAWHLASIADFSQNDFLWLLDDTPFLSVEQVFESVSLNPQQFAELLSPKGLPPGHWQTNLSPSERQSLKEIFRSPHVRAAVCQEAQRKRGLAMEYLRQEGLFDGTPFGLVDIGWHGRLQSSLSRLMTLGGEPATAQLTGFYFGLVRCPEEPGQSFHGYWNAIDDPYLRMGRFNGALLERFTAGDHGPVSGYSRNGDRLEAQFASPENTPALTWGLRQFQTAVLHLADVFLAAVPQPSFDHGRWREVSCALYAEFYQRPSAGEAQAWGRFPFSSEQVERNFENLVPEWNHRQIWRALRDYRLRPTGWWLEGTLALKKNLPLRFFLAARKLRWRLQGSRRKEAKLRGSGRG